MLMERTKPQVMSSNEINVLEVDYILANYTRKLNQESSFSPRSVASKEKSYQKPNPMTKISPLEKFSPEELMSKNLQKVQFINPSDEVFKEKVKIKQCQQNKTKIGKDSMVFPAGERVESSVGDITDMPEDEQNENWLRITKSIKRKHQLDKMDQVIVKWVKILWK